MSGGSQTTTGTPASWASPMLQQNATTAQGLANQPGTSMVAPMTTLQNQGINSIQNTATSGSSPSAGAASANEFETSGALLNPASNPYLAGTFNQAANQVQNQLSTEFAGSGSNVLNSLPVQSDEMNNLATQLYGGQYDTGLNTMTQASALAPSIESGTYIPGQELYGAGTSQQTQNQNVINAPYNALSWYSGLLGNSASPSEGSTTTQSGNGLTTALGATSVLGGLLGGSTSGGAASGLTGLLGNLSNYLGGYTQSPTGGGSNQLNTVTPYTNDEYTNSGDTGLLNSDGSLNLNYLQDF